MSQSLNADLQVYQEIQRKHINQCQLDNHANITVIEYRTVNIEKIQRKLSLIAKWTVMQDNKDIVRNSVLVNSREIDNMTFMQNVTVIECRTASISGNSKKTYQSVSTRQSCKISQSLSTELQM